MKNTFNWGVIGCGRVAHKFADDIQAISGASIHAVATRSLAKAKDFAKRYNAPHALDSYEALLEIEGLDVVYIATPHALHAENSIMCLKAKIPVLCEKPLAMNTRQVQQMIVAARDNETFLMEALWTRYLPSIAKTLELIKSGEIGDLNSVNADFGFAAEYNPEGRLFNRDLGGGALLDIGIYPLFLALLLFGKPEHINANATFGTTGVDTACDIVLKFPQDKMASLHSTILSDTKTEAFIYGSRGYIHIHPPWHKMTSLCLHHNETDKVRHFEFEKKGHGYSFEAAEVMHCIVNKKIESDAMSHAFSLLLIETLDAIRHKSGIVYSEDKIRP